MKDKFAKALENNDIFEMRKVPKGDLHNHGKLFILVKEVLSSNEVK